MKIILDGEALIDSEEVAKQLKIALPTLKIRIRAKEIPLPIKLKTRVFWKEANIREYLKNKENAEEEELINSEEEGLIDSKEVAKLLEITLPTLQVRIRAKEIPLPIKLKNKNFWKKSDIEEYLKNNEKNKD